MKENSSKKRKVHKEKENNTRRAARQRPYPEIILKLPQIGLPVATSTVEEGGGSPNPTTQEHGNVVSDTSVTRTEVCCGTQLHRVEGNMLRFVLFHVTLVLQLSR